MTTSIVPSPSVTVSPLSSDDIRRVAPSVYAEHAPPGVSSRYSFVCTAQVLEMLDAQGWVPSRVSQQRVRALGREGYQMHEVRLARRVDLEKGFTQVGDTRPEMILQNAHDGSRAYRIDAGLYRLVCRNGLTVADAAFAHVSVRHVDVAESVFVQAAQSVSENIPLVLETVARWQGVQLSPAGRTEFARRALALRWTPEQPAGLGLTPEQLLSPWRAEDQGSDLWRVFNVLDEHLGRGGDVYRVDRVGRSPRVQRTRAVTGLRQRLALNKSLWSLAEEFSRN